MLFFLPPPPPLATSAARSKVERGEVIITERDKSFQHLTFQYSRWIESLKCSVYAYFVVFVCLFIGSWLAHSATEVWHKVKKGEKMLFQASATSAAQVKSWGRDNYRTHQKLEMLNHRKSRGGGEAKSEFEILEIIFLWFVAEIVVKIVRGSELLSHDP